MVKVRLKGYAIAWRSLDGRLFEAEVYGSTEEQIRATHPPLEKFEAVELVLEVEGV